MTENQDYIRQVEINGVKLEVDMRTAKRIDTFKVGDNVKILIKEYSCTKIYNGVIVEFLNFNELPTIQVAYFEDSWNSSELIKFININEETKDFEILPTSKHEMTLTKSRFLDKLNNKIAEKQNEVDELTNKRDWFVENYEKHFVKENL